MVPYRTCQVIFLLKGSGISLPHNAVTDIIQYGVIKGNAKTCMTEPENDNLAFPLNETAGKAECSAFHMRNCTRLLLLHSARQKRWFSSKLFSERNTA
jgi:hypothetical protein